jgi:ATP-dependent protease ClpP protease subunit
MAEIKSTTDTQEKNSLVNVIPRSCNDIYINLDATIDEPKTYRDVYDTLIKSNADDKIYVIINTHGGYISAMNQIVNNLLETKSETTAVIHDASSAGAGIALACDNIVVKHFGYMFIHNASTGSYGKINELDAFVEHRKRWVNEMSNALYRGFLTDVELKSMLDGKDFYFDKIEIEKRLLNWVPMRKR